MRNERTFSPPLHPLLQVYTSSWFSDKTIKFLRFWHTPNGTLCRLFGVADEEGEVVSKVVMCSREEIHEFNRRKEKENGF